LTLRVNVGVMNNRILYWLRICTTIFCCVLFFHIADAQKAITAKLRFEHLGTDQGFPQSAMTDIKQDKAGFIWIATRDGVYRYDGYSFRSFSHPVNDKSFFKSQETENICVCSDSTVWIAAVNGLYYFNALQEKLVKVRFTFNEDSSFDDEAVLSICEDHKKNLWFVTNQGELFSMNSKTRAAKLFYKDGFIKNVFIDHDGNIWLGTESRGLYRLGPVTKQIEAYQYNPNDLSSISGNNVKQVTEDRSGKLWISTWSGLSRFNPATQKFTRYSDRGDDAASIGFNGVNCVLEDHNGSIWTASYRGGLSRYNPTTDNFVVYRNNPADPQSLGSNHVTALCEDRGGVLWIGTYGGGLNKVSLNQEKFRVYTEFDAQPRTHFIISLYTSRDGKIWMGTLSGGFFCFDPSTKQFTQWHWNEYDMVKGTYNTVYGFAEAADGTMWIVTTMEGLLSLNRKTRKVTIHNSLAIQKGLAQDYGQYTSVCIDDSSKIWIGSLGGLKIFDPANNLLNNYDEIYKKTNPLSTGLVNCVFKDENGLLWIGGSEGGLARIDTRTNGIKVYYPHKSDPDSVSDDAVNSMTVDTHGYLWLAYGGGGLVVFDRNNEFFRTFSIADGLPSNDIKGVLGDKANNIWILTGNGISRCSLTVNESPLKGQLIVRNYDIGNGPGSNDVSYTTGSTKGNDGTFYFGTFNGLVAFHPDSMKDNEYKPPVVLTEFLLDNRRVYPEADSGFLKRSITLEKEIKLSYKRNVIGFTFAALSYDHPEHNKYAYKLEGFDKDWVYTDASHRTVTYTNLHPRKYIFHVKASNNDGIWNEKEATIVLIITPPFWQTWWFYSLCAFFVGTVLYAIYRYRLRQVIKLQTIRNNIASDLHDDIGSTLNSISIFSEVAKQQAKENIPALEEIGISSRKIIDSMSDIVWTINPENDSFEKIVQRMRSFAHQVLKAKKIEMVFKADTSLNEIALSMPVRKNFYLIFKEATNNIVKYSDATRVSFVINNAGKEVRLEIRDNGNGFHLNGSLNGNGIKNMKRRAEEIKAQLNIVTAVGEGTSIEVILRT
jgi:ligand-binding sensor domain-containing protein/two-component sensor histidine kinase